MANKSGGKPSDRGAGKRNDRNRRLGTRVPELGYYLIVTDTEETEKNYFEGLRDSISPELKDRLVIKVEKAKTVQLLRDGEELSFVLTEEDFRNQALAHDNLINWIFPRNYVMASVEDTDIATINENFILGKKKGTTTLRLYVDNQVLAYMINVES